MTASSALGAVVCAAPPAAGTLACAPPPACWPGRSRLSSYHPDHTPHPAPVPLAGSPRSSVAWLPPLGGISGPPGPPILGGVVKETNLGGHPPIPPAGERPCPPVDTSR